MADGLTVEQETGGLQKIRLKTAEIWNPLTFPPPGAYGLELEMEVLFKE